MPNIIQRLRDTYTENPAAALKLIPEVLQAHDEGRTVELPVAIGSTVWVSPNCGKSFHTGKLYGTNETRTTFLVFVDDKERDLVANPLGRCFYDWFSKIYTREAAEKALEREL